MMTTTTDQLQAASDLATFALRLGELLVSLDAELIDRLADDVTLRASGVAEWAGTYEGKPAVLAYLAEIGDAFPDTTTEVIDTLVSATRIAVLVQLTVRRDGAVASDRGIWTFTFDANGRINDWEINDFDQVAMDEFWGCFPRRNG
jgi:ketosteroid isomerase-like protein